MRIQLDTIPEQGLTIRVTGDDAWAAAAAEHVLEVPPAELEGELHLRKTGELVTVHASIRTAAPRDCERCTEATRLALESDRELAYVPAAHQAEGAEIELASGELDVGWYRDDALDLGDVLSEALALELPSRVVCTDEAGCESRTAALLETRGSAGDRMHPGFEALRKFGS